jgi:hypothetical protein
MGDCVDYSFLKNRKEFARGTHWFIDSNDFSPCKNVTIGKGWIRVNI